MNYKFRIIIFFLVFFNSYKSSSQVFDLKDRIVTFNYGYPYLVGILSINSIKSIDYYQINSSNYLMNFNLKYERMVSLMEGLGIEVYYRSYGVEGLSLKDTTMKIDFNNMLQVNKGDRMDLTKHRLNINFRLIKHFEVRTVRSKLDLYFSAAPGLRFGFSNNRSKEVEEFLMPEKTRLTDPIFVSLRFCVGLNYVIKNNLGLNLELGLGGSVVSGGLFYKIPNSKI
jgi:hypothetical protein